MTAKVVITVTDGKDGFTINFESSGDNATEPEIMTANMIIILVHSAIENIGWQTTEQVKG